MIIGIYTAVSAWAGLCRIYGARIARMERPSGDLICDHKQFIVLALKSRGEIEAEGRTVADDLAIRREVGHQQLLALQ